MLPIPKHEDHEVSALESNDPMFVPSSQEFMENANATDENHTFESER